MLSTIIMVVSFVIVGSLLKGVVNLKNQRLPEKYLEQ